MFKAAGDEIGVRECNRKIRLYKDKYNEITEKAGLNAHYDRMNVVKGGNAGNVHTDLMAAAKTDWSQTTPIIHNSEEQAELIKYAQSKGIEIYNIQKFDGDSELLKEQIDIISNMRSEYKLTGKLTITFDSMADDDFASTNGKRINFNTKCLRNREITNEILSADNTLAANDISGIATHEVGHLISKKYGEKGLEIASKAYYNINGKQVTLDIMPSVLEKELSLYASESSADKEGTRFNAKHYKEVIPEALSKNQTNPNAFTNEFVKLLKEVVL